MPIYSEKRKRATDLPLSTFRWQSGAQLWVAVDKRQIGILEIVVKEKIDFREI